MTGLTGRRDVADTELEWEPLASSHVDAMAYDRQAQELYVRFRNGSVWKYPADAEEAEGLRRASSPGKFVHYFLKRKGEKFE